MVRHSYIGSAELTTDLKAQGKGKKLYETRRFPASHLYLHEAFDGYGIARGMNRLTPD